MTACGENNSTNGNENQIKRENSVNSLLQISDENSQLKSLKGKITSIDDTQPVYFYSQNFDFEEETYKKSYELIYQFKVALLHKDFKDIVFLSYSNLSDNLGMRSA